ncbi:MAG: hypothetical protein ACOY3P_15375 [Planctomycetota bacterium]
MVRYAVMGIAVGSLVAFGCGEVRAESMRAYCHHKSHDHFHGGDSWKSWEYKHYGGSLSQRTAERKFNRIQKEYDELVAENPDDYFGSEDFEEIVKWLDKLIDRYEDRVVAYEDKLEWIDTAVDWLSDSNCSKAQRKLEHLTSFQEKVQEKYEASLLFQEELDGYRDMITTPNNVPEPATWLLGLAFASTGMVVHVARRRRGSLTVQQDSPSRAAN